MGFIRITHESPEVGDAVIDESATEVFAETGWTPVDPTDVRAFPSDFEVDLSPEAPARPAKSASKAAWQEYAVAVGLPEDVVADKSRDELITQLVPQED